MPILKSKNAKVKVDRPGSSWLHSGLAVGIVVVNGLILTLAVFMVFKYYTNNIANDEYKKISETSGRVISDNISELEDSMRLVSTVLLLSKDLDKEMLTEKIRRNIPNLSKFDQLLWLYEESPGNWQYKTIFTNVNRSDKAENYTLAPDKEFITKLIRDRVFSNRDLKVKSDFVGMDYKEKSAAPYIVERSFAFIKAVEPANSKAGIVVGVSRPTLLFGRKISTDEKSISRIKMKNTTNGNRLFFMAQDREDIKNEDQENKWLTQNFSFYVADSEWQISMELSEKKDISLLTKVPYIVLIFGLILTLVGTLFIRNNQNQAKKLSRINKQLGQKNTELELEISERERLNKAIAISERDNRAIIDAVSDVIFEVDVEGSLLFLSASWQNITGFTTERSLKNNIFSMLYPEDQLKQKHDFELLLNGQKQAYRAFTRLRIADGTFRAIELAISMIRKDENKDLRIVGTITDVEERRRAERALAEAEKKYRTIVENAAGGLYQLTPEGLYLSANPAMARILGYNSPEEILRMVKNANGTVYANEIERNAFIETLINQDHIEGYESEVYTKDRSKIWVRENVRVVRDEHNNILYFEGSMEDITLKKEADIALMEAKIESDLANRAKTEFISNMSHELRTPLNAIIGFSDILQKEVMGPLGQDTYKEYAADINQSGQGLLKIINEILDISKIESGNRELNESEFDSGHILQNCLDIQSRTLKEKEITVINDAQMPVMTAEELTVKQAIGNILSNAVKYTPKAGRITLFTNVDSDGTFRLSITDTGIGMTDNEIKKALSPFGQVDNALDRSGSGTGLGLPLTHAIMKIHNGRMEILSEKSIGTTVTLIFPPERIRRKQSSNEDITF